MTTTFHCDKLCGNTCCKQLRKAIVEFDASETEVDGDMWDYVFAHDTINDPAKLAELMASALRSRGIHVLQQFEPIVYPCAHATVKNSDIVVRVWPVDSEHGTNYVLSPSECRAKILAIMKTTPDESSRKTCEQILKGEP